MPHFSETDHDVVMCQVCGRDIDCGREEPQWRPDVTGKSGAGNACQHCVARFERSAGNNHR